jgi:acetylornithine deacetylase
LREPPPPVVPSEGGGVLPDAREILARLVSFPTVSQESNLPLVDWAEGYLAGLGAACRRTWSDDRRKVNLLATFGPEGEGGIVLSGHTDVVPAQEEEWSSDPFRLVEREGRLYGRGTADMKGFLAAVLAVAPALAAARLRCPVHLAFSYDEEVGCLGAPRMIHDMVAAGLRPEIAIVGEPSGMRPAGAHKSVNLFRTRVVGAEAHSSQPHLGAGAIFAAGRLVEALWRLGEEARAAADPGRPFEPPWTTVQVGTIQGGTAMNVLPRTCTFTWEYRALPGEDQDRILRAFREEVSGRVLPALREFAPSASIETIPLARVPPLAPEAGGAAESLVRQLTGEAAGPTRVVSYGTEGGQFQAAGISTVICGPGSIDRAHRPDEFLEVEQLERCVAFLLRLLEQVRD